MSKENVEALCKKAAEASSAGEAQAYAQAACNVANAMCAAKAAEKMKNQPCGGVKFPAHYLGSAF